MSKCIYDVSEDCNNTDCLTCVLDKIRTEISEYGSIWVEYKITGKRDKDIEQLVSDVLSQAKKQVLEIIDKYKEESEREDEK